MNKVFQTFIGTPSDSELECMKQTKEKFDSYSLFSDSLEGSFPMDAIEKTVSFNDRTKYLYSKCTNPTEQNDILRLCFLWRHPDYWYLDCDAILEEFPEIEGNKPYFAEYKGKVDGFIIFGNNNKGVFRMILNDIYRLVKTGKPVFLAQHEAIRNQPMSIPKKYFKHKGL